MQSNKECQQLYDELKALNIKNTTFAKMENDHFYIFYNNSAYGLYVFVDPEDKYARLLTFKNKLTEIIDYDNIIISQAGSSIEFSVIDELTKEIERVRNTLNL